MTRLSFPERQVLATRYPGIRRATHEDIDGICALPFFLGRASLRYIHHGGISPESLSWEFRKLCKKNHEKDTICFVCEEAGETHGFIWATKTPDSEQGDFIIGVRDSDHHHGIGMALFLKLIDEARHVGFNGLFGLVLADNESMCNLLKLIPGMKEEYESPGVKKFTLSFDPIH